MTAAGHDRDTIICQGQFNITVNSLFLSCVCGHAMLHRNVVGLYDTLNFFPLFHDKQTTQELHCYPESRFHMLFVSLRLSYRLRKLHCYSYVP